jgi:hypothetical protein
LTLSVFSLLSIIGRKVVIAWTVAVCLFNICALYTTYQPMAKSGDWFRVNSYIAASESAGQPILVFRSSSVLPLAHYYHGPNHLVPIPTPFRFDKPGPYFPNRITTSEQQLDAALRQFSSSPEVWLVTGWQSGFSGDGIDDPVLKKLVERTYTIEKSRTFYYSKVFQLRRKPSSN